MQSASTSGGYTSNSTGMSISHENTRAQSPKESSCLRDFVADPDGNESANRGNSRRSVTNYFESTADYWKTVYSEDRLLPHMYRDRHTTALGWIQQLDLHPRARILEVGCGAGLITSALARSGYTVDALDSTLAMLQMTRNEASRQGVEDQIRMHFADVHALPFQAHTFDLVIALGVIP